MIVQLLRAHAKQRTTGGDFQCLRARFENTGDAKVGQSGCMLLINQNVAGFDIPMHQPHFMSVTKGVDDRLYQPDDR